MSFITSVDGIELWLLTDLFGHLSRDVTGRLSIRTCCYWLLKLEMSLVRLDPSTVKV